MAGRRAGCGGNRRAWFPDEKHEDGTRAQRGYGNGFHQRAGIAGLHAEADLWHHEAGGAAHQGLASAAHLFIGGRHQRRLRPVVVERQLHLETEEVGRA